MQPRGFAVIAGTVSLLAATIACGGGRQPEAQAPSPSASPVGAAEPARAAAGACTQEVPVPVRAVAFHDVKWQGNGGHGEGNDPHFILSVPNYGAICAVRLRFSVDTHDPQTVFFQVAWGKGMDFGTRVQNFNLSPGAGEQTVTVNVNDEIDTLRVDPATRPVDFKISELVLTTRAGATPH